MSIRILSRRDTARKISTSPTQVDRLTLADKFPQPIWVSSRRKGWLEHEVDKWIQEKIDARESTTVNQ